MRYGFTVHYYLFISLLSIFSGIDGREHSDRVITRKKTKLPYLHACYKAYLWKAVFVYKATSREEMLLAESVSYTYGSFNLSMKDDLPFKSCNDVYENSSSVIHTSELSRTVEISYNRYCLSCHHNCSDDTSFRKKCNTPPKFTGNCYSYTKWNDSYEHQPQLHSYFGVVPITPSMVCYKAIRGENNSSHYIWGGTSLTPGDRCGHAFSHFNYNGCSCCGELCNGLQMNSIFANGIDCGEYIRRSPSDSSEEEPTVFNKALGKVVCEKIQLLSMYFFTLLIKY